MYADNRFKTVILPISVFIGTLWIIYKAIAFIFHVFSSLNPNVVVAIIAGVATIMASTSAVLITRYYQVKGERESAHRDRKIVLYDEFISKLYSLFHNASVKESQPEILTPFLHDTQRKLLLWAGPGAIKAYAEWNKAFSGKKPPHALQMVKTMDFILALRADVGLSNSGIKHEHIVRYFLGDTADMFMEQYRKNPKITLDEISKLERGSVHN